MDFAQRLGQYVRRWRPVLQNVVAGPATTSISEGPRDSTQFHSQGEGDVTVSLSGTEWRAALSHPPHVSAQSRAAVFQERKTQRFLPLILGGLWLALAGGLTYLTVQNFFQDSQATLEPVTSQPISEVRQSVVPSAVSSPAPLQAEDSPLAKLTIRAFPPQSQLVARYAGHEKNSTGILSLEGLSEGTEVKVRASLSGYESSVKTFKISERHRDLREEIRLSPVLAKKTEYGFLTINALPWGKASIAGVVSGKGTPLTERVPIGSYRVTVDGGTGHRASGTVRVNPDSTTKCRVNFKGDGKLSC